MLVECGKMLEKGGYVIKSLNTINFRKSMHYNYLKRKANGKQKEYEERTKAKKKAEIEARKQAIRTEDIARGVFIPVSSLPQLGPRKGA